MRPQRSLSFVPSRPSSRAAVVLIVTAALAGVWAADAAGATGDLHVFSGRMPDGTPTTIGPWSNLTYSSPGGSGTHGVQLNSAPQGASVTATLAPPPGLSIAAAAILRSYAAPVSSYHSQPQIETSWESRGHPYTGQSGGGGYVGDSGTGPVSVDHPSSLFMRVSCVNFDGTPGSCAASYLLDRLDLTLHDDDAPTVTGTMTGELLDGAWKTSTTGRVAVTAADAGSGVYRAFVRESATTWYASIDAAATRCRDAVAGNGSAYEFIASPASLVPCATASSAYEPAFDLTALGDGTHTVSLGIEDAGGNERTVLSGRTLRVNAPGGALPDAGTTGPGGCVYAADGQTCTGGGGGGGTGGAGTVRPIEPSPAGGSAAAERPTPPAIAPITVMPRPCNGDRCGATARIALSGTGGQSMSVRFGARARIAGQLLTPEGAPIAGATVELVAATVAGVVARTTTSTDASGRFAYDAPAGLSGAVAVVYRSHLDEDAEAARLEVRVRVISGVRLHVDRHRTRNKQAVRFTGQIRGAPTGSRKMVELQAYADGRWVTFATTRSRGGRFGYAYRFQRTYSTQTYGFRAVVRGETGWPYLTGSSNRVYVEVLGT